MSAEQLRNHVGGEWVAAGAHGTLPVTDPATDETFALLPLSDDAEIDAAVAAAKAAFWDWRMTPVPRRAAILFRYRQLVVDAQDEIARIIVRENGKPLAEAKGEIVRAVQYIEHAAAAPELMKGSVSENVATGVDIEYIREPLGVFAIIAPFNFPAMIPLYFTWAVATGNTVVMKPSEQCPLTTLKLTELAVEAGLPAGVLNIVMGDKRVVERLAAHPDVAAGLVRLFSLRFDPAVRDEAAAAAVHAEILAALDGVTSLEHDRVLRNALGLVDATVRTNAFRPDRTALSLKFRSSAVPEMPKPVPLYEIFVYATETEAIHLRRGAVAHGGIRWSDRLQDYRTEVLDLMKAQTVKNAVIVPNGAKGGFVVKRPPADPTALRDAVRRSYVTFMRGMLDVTDNLVGGAVVHPEGVVVLDEDDPYLVVAADKGTATFSDTANEVAADYRFWLGDAFASGGSAGYDHKALGITARGA